MRIKNTVDAVVVFFLSLILCWVYTIFFIWLLRKLAPLEGVILQAMTVLIFLIFGVMHYLYYTPALKAHLTGLSEPPKKPPLFVICFDMVGGSMLSTFFIMAFVEEFFSLDEAMHMVVTYLVFVVLILTLFIRLKIKLGPSRRR